MTVNSSDINQILFSANFIGRPNKTSVDDPSIIEPNIDVTYINNEYQFYYYLLGSAADLDALEYYTLGDTYHSNLPAINGIHTPALNTVQIAAAERILNPVDSTGSRTLHQRGAG